MSEVENFIINRGINGCPLLEIPTDLLAQINDSIALEIVKHENNTDFPTSLIVKTPPEQVFTLNQISSNFDGFDIRFTFEMWRRVIFRTQKFHSAPIIKFIQILFENPEGVTKEQAELLLGNSKKRVPEWSEGLHKAKILDINNGIIKYKFDWVNGSTELPDDLFTSPSYCVTKQSAIDLGFLPNNSISKKRMVDAEKEIKGHDKGVELRVLKKKLNLNVKEVNGLVDELKSRDNYVVGKDHSVTKVSYLGELGNSYIDPTMINYLIDMCTATKIFMLSDLPKDLKKLKNTMNLEEVQFISILEDYQFNIIEIRSKYINSEFVVFASFVEGDDADLLLAFEKAKSKISRNFYIKVKTTFLKNIYLNSFDNNYSPFLKERVKIFYKFILSEMKNNQNYFCLNSETLLNMSFSSFVKCVPFRSDFQFFKIAFDASKRLKKLENSFLIKNRKFDDITAGEYEELNCDLLDKMSHYTVLDILKTYKKGTEGYKNLISKVNVYEFDRIIHSLVKYNIFEGFSTDKYFYLEQIEGIENYIEKVLFEITEESCENANVNISYPARKHFFDQIIGFSQDEFYQKTVQLVEASFEGDVKEFFLKKVRNFK